MKNKLFLRMYIVLVLTVLAISIGIYFIVSTFFYNAMLKDVRQRSIGVKNYVVDYITYNDFKNIGSTTEEFVINENIQKILNQLQGASNLKNLYLAKKDDNMGIITTMSILNPEGVRVMYLPTGNLKIDLQKSLDEAVAVLGTDIYKTEQGSLYTMFWPVLNSDLTPMGAICMEFDVSTLVESRSSAAIYSVVLISSMLILLISFISFIFMGKLSEPFYKKIAYTDFLTGLENRMAFEQRLRECGPIADSGEKVTLIIFDVNNLKTINDTLGHDKGDTYLKNTAEVIDETFNKFTNVYRIGGDEFAGISVGPNEENITSAIECLSHEKKMMLKGFPFSCAAGYASYEIGLDNSLRDVFKRADEAMYLNKKEQKAAKLEKK